MISWSAVRDLYTVLGSNSNLNLCLCVWWFVSFVCDEWVCGCSLRKGGVAGSEGEGNGGGEQEWDWLFWAVMNLTCTDNWIHGGFYTWTELRMKYVLIWGTCDCSNQYSYSCIILSPLGNTFKCVVSEFVSSNNLYTAGSPWLFFFSNSFCGQLYKKLQRR